MNTLKNKDHGHPDAADTKGFSPREAIITNILSRENITISFFALFASVLVVYYKATLLGVILLFFLSFLSLRKISWLLYLTIFIVAFKHAIRGFMPQHIFFGRTLLPGDALFAFLFAGLIFNVVVENRKSFLSQKIDKSIIIFSLIILYGFLYGILSGYHDVFRASRGLLFYLPLPFLVVYLQNLKNSAEERLAFIKFLFFFFITVNFISILVSLGYLNVLFHSKKIGHSLGFYRPNKIIDTILSLPAIFFGLYVLQYYRRTLYTVLSTICIMLGVGCLMVSVTRGFLIGFAATLLLLTFISKKSRLFSFRIMAALLLLIPALLFLKFSFDVDFVNAYKTRFHSSIGVTDRLMETADYLTSFKQKPIMGQGFGSPVKRYYSSGTRETSYSHNDYMFFLQTVGLLGFVVFLWFLIRSLWISYLAAKHAKTEVDSIISLLTLSLLISFTIISLVAPEFRNFSTVPLLVTLISFSYSIKRENEPLETG